MIKISFLFFLCSVLFSKSFQVNNEIITVQYHPLSSNEIFDLDKIPVSSSSDDEFRKSIRVGNIELNSIKYLTAIFNLRTSKYADHSRIWIDTFRNKKYDYYIDFMEQMYLPFTINGNSYKIIEIDSTGKYIKIRNYNHKEIPPIAVGYRAPNLIATTINKDKFELAKMQGKNVFLYFWTCNSNIHFPEMEKVVNQFQNKNIEFVCLSNRFDISERNMPWTHIFLEGLYDERRILYQVGGMCKLFLIDPDGIIKSIDHEFVGEELIKIIDKNLN